MIDQILVSMQDQDERRELERQLLERLNWLSFPAFLEASKLLLQRMSFQQVRVVGRRSWRGPSSHGGIDLLGVAKVNGFSQLTLIQIKQYGPVQRRFVDELRGAMLRCGAPGGLIITSRRFSQKAKEAAELYPGRPIHLVDGQALARLMIRKGLGVRPQPLDDAPVPRLVLDELFFERLEDVAEEKR